jgi:pimeloyl-ACP methyl ester carboxylesterase
VLAAAGYHVIAPDQRGYNLNDKPAEVSAYDLDVLAADVIGLADYFGRHRFTIIGHDWGGSVGWWIAAHHAERLEQLAVLNSRIPASGARRYGAIPSSVAGAGMCNSFGCHGSRSY